ncbi:MAG: phytochromobilin:ferredoxin oxidoreductase [Desulfobacterota bacterium]|nr:phytochromobilin:ferredoxin oxidoreductase [Thermodesulfobacteriota bacterium]
MENLESIHQEVLRICSNRLQLMPVTLKHPFPERPVRTLGLVKLDGQVFSSDKLQRIVLFTMQPPFYLKIYSTFIRPKLQYDLPVFSCEVVCMGSKKKMFLVDAHRTGGAGIKDYTPFFDRLIAIRDQFPDLMRFSKVTGKGIQSVFSKAVCQVTIPPEMDGRALELFSRYCVAYIDLIDAAEPLAGDDLKKIRSEFEAYLKTVIDHDPGMKGNIILFGKKGGIERALDIFYGL